MTIDPMAAVTSVTGSAGSPAAGADPAASPSQTSQGRAVSEVRVADEGAKVDLYDYTSQHRNKPPAIDTLQPEGKANYLANPATLGEKVLQRIESLHQRSVDYHSRMHEGTSPPTSSSGSGDGVMSGPASSHVAGSAQPSSNSDGFSKFALMFDYAVETTMVSSSSSQFVSGVNTLMRGQ
ncbi:MAG: hypothetical protein ACR2P3_01545 [Geminicoccaceae bacterium]